MLRILHATSSYPLFHGDSTAPFMEEMLTALVGRGHDVTVVVPRVDGLKEGSRDGIKVIGAPYAPRPLQTWGYGKSLGEGGAIRPSAIATTPLALSSMAIALRADVRRKPPDGAHLHWILPQGVLAAALPRSVPVVVSLHGADARFVQGHLKPVARRVLERADAVVAASSAILDFVLESHPAARSKSYVIPHGANGELFKNIGKSEAREGLAIDPSLPMVLAVGRLVRKKGFLHLIRSMDSVDTRGAELFIAGAGAQRAELVEAIVPSTRGRIHLIGKKPRVELAKWFAASDVVAIPSVPDGLDIDSGPVVLMEAMAAGRSVVATKIGMAPDLVEDDVNGYLVSSDQPEQLAAAIDRALASADRLGRGARRTFEAVGDWGRVAVALESVYSDAIAHRLHKLRSH